MEYDLIVIGGGPAGYLAAERAGRAGLSVLLAEKKALGGVCLNEGCIPTKTMLYSAKLYDGAVHGEKYGITVGNAELNHETVLNRKNKVVRTLVAGIKAQLRNSNVTVTEGVAEILGKSEAPGAAEATGAAEALGVAGASGAAEALGAAGTSEAAEALGAAGETETVGKTKNTACRDTMEVHDNSSACFSVRVGENIFKGRHILLTTGSVPVIPNIPGIEEGIANETVLTNSGILSLKEVPKELAVIGGGAIGLELASYFNSAGSKVTVIEMLDHIAGPTDREIAGILMKNYAKKGIDFRLNARVTEIRLYKSVGVQNVDAVHTEVNKVTADKATVVCETAGQSFETNADRILLSVGRRPATEGLGLENVGVAADRGRIITDRYGRTNVPGIYVAGDVNGISMLAHTAYREAEVCVNNMLGREDSIRYDAIPSVIYTNPEVAGVGETEETAAEKGIDFDAAKLPMGYSGRYAAENEGGDGICKVLVEKNSRRIIGVHMIGNYSSEIIYGAAMMIERKMTPEDVKKLVFPHPTVSEIIREVIYRL